MRDQLFRQEAMDARQITVVGSVLRARRLSFGAITAMSIIFAIGLIGIFVEGQYTRKVHVSGYLAPAAGLIKVHAGQVGVLAEKRIREGQAIRRGEVLYLLSTERSSATALQVQAAATAAIHHRLENLALENDTHQQVALLQISSMQDRLLALRGELTQIRAMTEAQRQRVADARDTQTRYEHLMADGFVAAPAVQQKHDDFIDQSNHLAELMRSQSSTGRDIVTLTQDAATARLTASAEQLRYERERYQLSQEALESDLRSETAITAPVDGVATAVMGEAGQTTQPETLLLAILPSGSLLQAQLLVPTQAIGFMMTGDVVSLRYHAFPYQRFGSFKGRIAEIPRTTVSAAELDVPATVSGAVYRVTVALDDQRISTGRATVDLQSGMSLDADIWLERRRLMDWVLEPIVHRASRI